MAETTPRKKVLENQIDSCRCCNSNTDPHRRIALFGTKSSNEGFVNAIKQLAGIVVSENDGLSCYICRTCATNISNLSKKITDFKNKCTDTAKKQSGQVSSVREKRGRKDDTGISERSPLPQQATKKALVEKRVATRLENRFREIAPKPGPSSSSCLPPPTNRPLSSDDHMPPSNTQPLVPQSPHAEGVSIISNSGLLGVKVL